MRAGCVSSISSDLFLSGSFDHTVKLYDARSPTGSTISVDHGSPVESVLMYPSNSIFVSVGKIYVLENQSSMYYSYNYLFLLKVELNSEFGIC